MKSWCKCSEKNTQAQTTLPIHRFLDQEMNYSITIAI
jgi:hypothetical protein